MQKRPQSTRAFTVEHVDGLARAGTLHLPHGPVRTPVFMPVGTQATVKGLTNAQMTDGDGLDLDICLANTYHLGLRPGGDALEALGGIHTFSRWPRNVLTDSGGFQMVSLLQFSQVTEHGVHFQSPVDGSAMLLTPERSMELQNQIGADIIMALDDVVPATATDAARFAEATERTIRWLDRCIRAHRRPQQQLLFGIVQGGLDTSLRQRCLQQIVQRPLPGYAIGGLAGGEEKRQFWRVVQQCTATLPPDRPRYCMGVGYPADLLVCVALGVDMFDCVYPARTARFGSALVDGPAPGVLKVRAADMAADYRPLSADCPQRCCRAYSRAYLHVLAARDASVVAQLLTLHNVAYLTRLMRRARQAIAEGDFPSWVQRWFRQQYPQHDYPNWVCEALAAAGLPLP
ncbi:hypothetical protein CDCA_CDCA16G4213 [Cyanidium caldarium]|uniref:Queuine tRNA-ribosyltransferase catalytic subunit 1 n=1 Tax=Cyanidium caldarium TaxID=2771 RepID=A0AAV9J2B8_CYACA|nr:hypothetical protein CDCA_CDCA16G4213 [Cyanidium caldarium]